MKVLDSKCRYNSTIYDQLQIVKKKSVLTIMLVLTSYILWKVKSCHEYKLLFRQFFHVSSVQFRTYLAVNPVYFIVFLTMQFCCRFVQLNTDFSSLWTWSEKDLYGLQEIFVNHTEVIAVDIIFLYIYWMDVVRRPISTRRPFLKSTSKSDVNF